MTGGSEPGHDSHNRPLLSRSTKASRAMTTTMNRAATTAHRLSRMPARGTGGTTADGSTAGEGMASGRKPAARSNSSRSCGVSRSLAAQRNTSSRWRGRLVSPSFQRKIVWRRIPMARASSASLIPARRMCCERSCANESIFSLVIQCHAKCYTTAS